MGTNCHAVFCDFYCICIKTEAVSIISTVLQVLNNLRTAVSVVAVYSQSGNTALHWLACAKSVPCYTSPLTYFIYAPGIRPVDPLI